MSLLDTASLLLTPNAYKEGKLYSVIPSDGSGDFTFTRATTATRVNSDGLVELVPYNLLQRSEEFDLFWSKTAVTVTANSTTSPSGLIDADRINTTGTGDVIYQTYSATTGQVLSSSIFLKNIDADVVGFVFTGAVATSSLSLNLLTGVATVELGSFTSFGVEALSNGWFRLFCTQTMTSTAGYQFRVSSASPSAVSSYFIWGAQLVEGTNALPYQKTETRLNIPRLDYSLGGCPSILLEPQRTNLLLQSSSFNSASWIKAASAVTVTANTAISPSGVQDADTIETNSSGSRFLYQIPTVTAGAITASVFAKKGTSDWLYLNIVDGSNNGGYTFNVNTGVVGQAFSSGVTPTASIVDYGNGWYRCIVNVAIAGTTPQIRFYVASSSSSVSTVPGQNIHLWGAQLEAGAYATSYIPTTTASVTRNNEVSNLTNVYTNGLISASGGTWFMELKGHTPLERATSTGGIFLNTGTFNTTGNGFTLRNVVSGSARFRITKIVASVNTNLFQIATDNAKVAIKWNGTTADIFVNGVKEISATDFAITAMENLYLDGTNRQAFISSMLLAPTPLTDDECIQLTTI